MQVFPVQVPSHFHHFLVEFPPQIWLWASRWHNLTSRLQRILWTLSLPVDFPSAMEPSAPKPALFNLQAGLPPPQAGKVWKANRGKQIQWPFNSPSAPLQSERWFREWEVWVGGRIGTLATCLSPAALVLHRVALLWDEKCDEFLEPPPPTHTPVCKWQCI